MIKRLGTLVTFTFFWLIAALVLPIVFWVVGGLILLVTILHMVLEGEGFGPGHRFFTIVSAITLLLATGGFFMGGDDPETTDVDGTAIAAALGDALDDDAVDDEEGDDDEEYAEEGDDDEEYAEEYAEDLPPVDVAAALKAANAAKRGKQCKSLETVAAAWRDLSRVPQDHKQFKKAKKTAAGLEKCRKGASAALKKAAVKTRSTERVGLAKKLQKLLAEAGLKLKAKPQGKTKNTLAFKGRKIDEAAIDEAFAEGSTEKGTILGGLQEAGFVKVSIAAGKVKRNYDLEPRADDAAALAEIEELGMSEPLSF